MQLFDRNVHKNHRGFDLHIQRPVSAVAFGLLLFPVCAFSQITVSPRAGGVTNTGNAAVGDVASGKTFSSSVLTNATGTSTKNATVPNDAPIQPPQAFVDHIRKFSGVLYEVDISNSSITHLDRFMVGDFAVVVAAFSTNLELNASGNNLPLSDVDNLLAHLASNFDGSPFLVGSTLDLSGVNMTTPTDGVNNVDAQTLVNTTNQWVIYINVGGVKTLVTPP